MRDTLAREGVGTGLVQRIPDAPTGTAVITVAGGENSIIVVAGANATLAAADAGRGGGCGGDSRWGRAAWSVRVRGRILVNIVGRVSAM